MVMLGIMTEDNETPEGVIIDELLCFVTNKFDILDCDTMVKLCAEKYLNKEIEKSKKLLFDKLIDEEDFTQFKKRRSYKPTDRKEEKNIRDIYQLLQEKGCTKWPKFVALDLSKLPPITFDHIDVTSLLNNIQNVKIDVDMLKEGLRIQTETSNSLREINAVLQNRVIELEKKSNETNIDIVDDISSVGTAPDDERPFKCTKCDYRYDNDDDVSSHNLNCQVDVKDKNVDRQKEIANKNSDNNAIHLFTCSECNYKFMTKQGLQEHAVTHNEQNMVCSECREHYKSNYELVLNLQSYHEKHSFILFLVLNVDMQPHLKIF